MSFTTGSNKWASRAVVALQLAAWSAVGIVVLEKGIASLKQHRLNNDSSSNVNSFSPSRDNVSLRQNHRQLPMASGKATLTEAVDTGNSNKSNSLLAEARMDASNQQQRNVAGATVILVRSDHVNNDESEIRSSGRKRSRPARFDATGGSGSGAAAAAVAMIAVGAIMLVLGPAVIVLRALDERRQERRFLKLSVQEDLPPSYEQATACSSSTTANILEPAPTYSSLNLDTISDNSAVPFFRSVTTPRQ